MTRRKRTYPNRSYLRLPRLYRQNPTTWTREEKAFVEEMEELVDDFSNRLPELCRGGRVDALFLAFERCRLQSGKLRRKLSLDAGTVVSPEWLADCLRNYLDDQWFKATSGKRERGRAIDTSMRALYDNLESVQLGSEFPLTRGVVLSESLAGYLREYLVGKWFEGTPGVRGRHSTTDERVKAHWKHYDRYSVVEDLRETGMGLYDARLNAPGQVPKSSGLGSAHAFEKSHKIVAKIFKDDPEAPLMALLLESVMVANAKPERSY